MALGRARRRERGIDYWPGFVDALSTLLLAIIFMLSLFMLAQYFLSQDINTKDNALAKLNAQIAEITRQLSMEKGERTTLQDQLAILQATLAAVTGDRDKLRLEADSLRAGGAGDQVRSLSRELDEQKRSGDKAIAQIELLNQQIATLRQQLATLNAALEASETRDRDNQLKLGDLGKRLNIALAEKVQELTRYRSEFFGRLRDILGNRPDVRIAGDRFVFQSELFFDPGSAVLKPQASVELDRVADALKDIERQIPAGLNWVLRVDGHTDMRPINTPQFPSNWALSSARAISVVQYFTAKGISPQHLVAAGFGEFQPIDPGSGEEALARNRRIELKLTER